jgi:hypothetical protein
MNLGIACSRIQTHNRWTKTHPGSLVTLLCVTLIDLHVPRYGVTVWSDREYVRPVYALTSISQKYSKSPTRLQKQVLNATRRIADHGACTKASTGILVSRKPSSHHIIPESTHGYTWMTTCESFRDRFQQTMAQFLRSCLEVGIESRHTTLLRSSKQHCRPRQFISTHIGSRS